MERKLFQRSDNEVINNALTKSLPHFQDLYKGFSTPEILKKAYHEIRGATQHKSLVTSKVDLDGKVEQLSDKTQHIVDTVKLPTAEEQKAEVERGITITSAEKKSSGAPSKSDMIISLLKEGKSGSEITKTLQAQGLKCYSSEIYNAKKKLGI